MLHTNRAPPYPPTFQPPRTRSHPQPPSARTAAAADNAADNALKRLKPTHPPPGTRNDECGWDPALLGRGRNPAAAPEDNRLTVHTIRDTRGRVLGLGSSSLAGGEGAGGDDDDDAGGGGGWEPVVEAWASHEAAVTGIDVAGGFGNLGGVSGVVTSGGDG